MIYRSRCSVCGHMEDVEDILRDGKCRDCWDMRAFKCVDCQRVSYDGGHGRCVPCDAATVGAKS